MKKINFYGIKIRDVRLNLFILIAFFFNLAIVSSAPYGANISYVETTTANITLPTSLQAYAGNITEVNIFGYSTTQSWQGYFGNVTGVLQLANSAGNVLYNWSLASPTGQIYATTNSSIVWISIQCFNFSANGSYCDSDFNNPGGYSQCGLNSSTLEIQNNISEYDVDGVNETFNQNNHARFYSNKILFEEGKCPNAKLFGPAGIGVFDEVLLYSPQSRAVIFTSILQRDTIGFDSRTHDFQMLVLDNGKYGNSNPTTYYFYLEIS